MYEFAIVVLLGIGTFKVIDMLNEYVDLTQGAVDPDDRPRRRRLLGARVLALRTVGHPGA